MKAKLFINKECNGIELSFTNVPEQETREALKTNGFRWHNVKKVWYAKQTDERLTFANTLAGLEVAEVPTIDKVTEVKPNNALMEEYKQNIIDVWGNDTKMFKHCMSKLSNLLKLENGVLIEFEKPSIETKFCFDDSRDYKGAQDMADYASKSEDYFLSENLKDFNTIIEALEIKLDELNGVYNDNTPYNYYTHKVIASYNKHYYKQSENNTLGYIRWLYLADYENENHETTEELTKTDIKNLLEVYKTERAKFEKRLHSYLKRYGMSKIQTWTYWGDR